MTLEQLYEARIDSLRSINYYGNFDCFCETVFFSLCDGDTGESLKSYEVSFEEETGEVDYDVEFSSEYDSGYCDFKRLPKQVREHVLAIVKAYIEEQAEEAAQMEATEEVEEKAEIEEQAEEAAQMEATEETTSYKRTLAQQLNELFRKKGSTESSLTAFIEQNTVSKGLCRSEGVVSYSMIFADGSVWGFGSIFENETELDNFGYNRIEIYNTIYCQ